MSDVEDVMAIAEGLEMNAREQLRFDLHIEDIKRNSARADFWVMVNIIFQVIFFWGLVILAITTGKSYVGNMFEPFFNFLDWALSPMNLLVAIVGPFSFFLMIYTGIIRRKWEGKLTRATAYALAFLSNIEHREFTALENEREKKRADIIKERKNKLQTAFVSGKISKAIYDRNMKNIEAIEKIDRDKASKEQPKPEIK